MRSSIKLYNNFFSKDYFHLLAVTLLSIIPILFFIGTGILNLSIILLDLIFIAEIFKKKRFDFFKNYIFYTLILLWFSFLINVFFSIDPSNSFNRGFGFIRFIFFIMSILYYLNIDNEKYQKIIFSSWLIIFSITTLDLIFELINGKNILGFESYIHGRLAGFFNDELIIGHFYYAFILIIISFLLNKFTNKKIVILNKKFDLKNFIYFFILLFLIVSFFIGERSNFIKTLIMIFLFTFLFERKYYKLKLILFSLFFGLIIVIININDKYQKRFVNQFVNVYLKNPVESISNSEHGGHYLTAIKIFDNNKIFGVGFRNYGKEIKKEEYKDFFYYRSIDPSTHPHQIHFEFLSELGLFGYFFLITFFIYHFIKFFKNKKLNNYLNLSGLLFVITSLLPILPSGSFFTSHAATFFWINFAIMCLRQKKLNY